MPDVSDDPWPVELPATATEIAAGVRTGELSAPGVVGAALERIAARDHEVGAFQVVRVAKAMAEAAEVERRAGLAQLPMAGAPWPRMAPRPAIP